MKSKFGNNLYLIAEIGVNHEGSIARAKKMIFDAKNAGAHAVKFQSYKASKIAAVNSPAYWDLSKESTKSQYELFSKYDSFTESDYIDLHNYCKKINIDFMSTPFDLDAVEFLDGLVSSFKIASADITNIPLLVRVASKQKPIILSTGCSTVKEIKNALSILEKNGCPEIILLHCILNYPTNNENANLGMIIDLQKKFPKNHIGYSDHTLPDSTMSVLQTSYILGCRVIEKHFTDDKLAKGNDHYHSMDKNDLSNFISKTVFLDGILGDITKYPLESEKSAILNARRSIYYNNSIDSGNRIKENDLISLRPGHGVSPIFFQKIIGKTLKKSVTKNTPFNWTDVE